MTEALPDPSAAVVLTSWTWQPITVVAAAALTGWYAWAVRRVRGRGGRWPLWRSGAFGLAILIGIWLTCGFAQVYASTLYWVWTAQVLALWLLVPAIALTGRPLTLARTATGGRLLDRLLNLPVLRVVHNPLVGPALVPLLSIVLFFGPLPAWATAHPVAGWCLQALLLAVGTLMQVPLLDATVLASSLAIGLSLAIGFFELVLDAIPGVVLRLHQSLVSPFFDNLGAAGTASWMPTPLHDQQTAGTILWVVAEVLDLPFILIVFVLWLRAEARDTAALDAVLDAERTLRQAGQAERAERAERAGSGSGRAALPADPFEPELGPADAPWWLTDPAMQHRLHDQE